MMGAVAQGAMDRRMGKAGEASEQRAAMRDAPANAPRLGEVIIERLDALAALSDEPGKLTRLYLGPAHRKAADMVAGWMRQAGMTVRVDATSTVVGRYEAAKADAPTLILGSHIDTVRNAGRFDGTLGVLAAISAVDRLYAAGRRPAFAIEVVAFGDEEGVRFPGTLTGSRALAGRFDPKLLDETDRDGISRRQALTAFGCDVSHIAAEARDPARVVGYIEVHIEQGPVLEVENLPVGVVTAINGATRGRITVTGGGGHAGTVPMRLRNDALAAASEMILAIEARAAGEPDLVATVGVLDVANAAGNAIPGSVAFSLDVRSPQDADRLRAVADIDTVITKIAQRRGVEVAVALTYDAPSSTSDATLVSALSAAIERNGYTPRLLPSGAGHDAMAFKDVIPFAMLFVRCRGGLSHHPEEHASVDDIHVAATVLADCVERFEP
jgi:allantoate deiminase